MDTLQAISFVIAAVLTVIATLFTLKFLKGDWLLFVVGRQVFTDDAARQDEFKKSGKRMAWVTGAFSLLMVTIIWYKAAEIAGNAALQTAGLYANNIMFLLFIVALVAFYVTHRMDKNKKEKLAKVDRRDMGSAAARMARRAQKARIDSFPTASIVFLIVVAIAAFSMGLLFGSI